jgi:hypothetical protein
MDYNASYFVSRLYSTLFHVFCNIIKAIGYRCLILAEDFF